MQSWDVEKSNIKQIKGFDVAHMHNSGKATVRNHVQFWCLQFKSNVEIVREVQRKGMKKDSEKKHDNTRHKQLNLFSSSGKKLRSDLVTAGRYWPMEKIPKSEEPLYLPDKGITEPGVCQLKSDKSTRKRRDIFLSHGAKNNNIAL